MILAFEDENLNKSLNTTLNHDIKVVYYAAQKRKMLKILTI